VVTDRLARAGATVLAPPTRTPWESLNARLDAPGGLQITVFSDARDESARRTEQEIMVGRVGAPERLDAPVVLVDPDPAWPVTAAALVADIQRALGDRVLLLEHVGSTSVPGLAAKPLIDLVLAVRDPADEPSYVGALEGLGYALRVREPDWQEHRMLRLAEPVVNLHVFGLGSEEVSRMLLFRDHLRSAAEDLALYERTKRGLARRSWEFVQQYADAKAPVVEQILARAARQRPARLSATYLVVPDDGSGATDLARRLEVPLLATRAVQDAAGAAGGRLSPEAARAVVTAIAATLPAAVLVGTWDLHTLRASLPGRVLGAAELAAVTPGRDALVRAVRQLGV
jgi:GrpB-like predicted nucleotidyltransferase (UPF0157 family)